MKHNPGRKSLVFGLLIIGLGVVWLMRNFGVIGESIWDLIWSWQMLLIAIGLISVSNGSERSFGWTLIIVGGFFMLTKYFDISISLWPVILILIGIVILFGSRRVTCFKKATHVAEGEDFIDEVAIFGGNEKSIHSNAFRGGKVVSIFGGSTLDLTKVVLVPGSEMEMVTIFGGSTLLVPSDWNVKIEVLSIFGAYSDKRLTTQVDINKTLTLRGVAIFGGGEVKTY
jgi:predicted membrane protein